MAPGVARFSCWILDDVGLESPVIWPTPSWMMVKSVPALFAPKGTYQNTIDFSPPKLCYRTRWGTESFCGVVKLDQRLSNLFILCYFRQPPVRPQTLAAEVDLLAAYGWFAPPLGNSPAISSALVDELTFLDAALKSLSSRLRKVWNSRPFSSGAFVSGRHFSLVDVAFFVMFPRIVLSVWFLNCALSSRGPQILQSSISKVLFS